VRELFPNKDGKYKNWKPAKKMPAKKIPARKK
jgi:hypothetical protein